MLKRDIRWIRLLLTVIVVFLLILTLKHLRNIFIPLSFAMLLSFLFAPLHRGLVKIGLPKWLSTVTVVMVIFVLLTIGGILVYTGVSSFVTGLPYYENMFVRNMQRLVSNFDKTFDMRSYFTQHRQQFYRMFNSQSVSGLISMFMGSFIGFFSKTFLTFIFLVFIFSEKDRFGQRMKKALTVAEAKYSLEVTDKIELHVQRYMAYKTFVCFITGLTSMLLMWVFGIKFILFGGLLHFALNYIPNIGSFVASAVVVMFYGIQYGFMGFGFVGVAIAFTSMQMFYGGYLEPRLMGTEFNISPIIILSSLVFWAWVWGGVGMLLAVPLTSAMIIMVRGIDSLKLVSALVSSD